jgi:predicted FMN-binding regulatory protein PaiB
MKDLPEYRVRDEDVVQLLDEQAMVRLITLDADGWPRIGLHVFVHRGLEVEVHLANDDPQLADIRRTARAVIEVDSVLSFSPSHWVDEENASHADQFYRFASLRAEPELVDRRAAVIDHLRATLARYQPEGRYHAVEDGHALYDHYVARLTLVRLVPTAVATKYKLAQTTPASARSQILQGLRERGSDVDQLSSRAIERHNSD